jgi:two-component system, NarL family, response regulator LiaR
MPGPLHVMVLSRHQFVLAGISGLLAHAPHRAVVVPPSRPPGLEIHVAVHDAGLRADHPLGAVLDDLRSRGVPTIPFELSYRLADDAAAPLLTAATTAEQLVRTLETTYAANDPVVPFEPGQDPRQALTGREFQLLQLIGAGMSNQEISEKMFVSINTVKTYVRTAYRRIGVTSRANAVLWAVRNGLVSVHHEDPEDERPQ